MRVPTVCSKAVFLYLPPYLVLGFPFEPQPIYWAFGLKDGHSLHPQLNPHLRLLMSQFIYLKGFKMKGADDYGNETH